MRWADFCRGVDEEHSSDPFPQMNCRGEFWHSSNKQLCVSKAATAFPAMIVSLSIGNAKIPVGT